MSNSPAGGGGGCGVAAGAPCDSAGIELRPVSRSVSLDSARTANAAPTHGPASGTAVAPPDANQVVRVEAKQPRKRRRRMTCAQRCRQRGGRGRGTNSIACADLPQSTGRRAAAVLVFALLLVSLFYAGECAAVAGGAGGRGCRSRCAACGRGFACCATHTQRAGAWLTRGGRACVSWAVCSGWVVPGGQRGEPGGGRAARQRRCVRVVARLPLSRRARHAHRHAGHAEWARKVREGARRCTQLH